MKKHYKENLFIEQLERVPNVSLACEKVGIARNTVYRWCGEDPDFKARMDTALKSGVHSINDLAESKLISHINNGSFRAIQYWLDNHKKEYIKPRDKNMWQPFVPVTKIEIVGLEDFRVKSVEETEEVPEVSEELLEE
ncbi:MAG: hypothetical protein COY01_02910 [Candidatus Pacebacteria bacterium CG_4_10_14_0_2_um_filter_40_20]|nr:MAG: hypothetical protein COY01_02910 [Candidatus Pacebacteria bacterium CG_4_10_14_0_2_um_filter_40_20]